MAKRVHDLECWQLADGLRREVHAICAQEHVARCFRFCEGFTEAAGSVCRNMAEGFDRFESPAIVQFFGYALGSLGEVEDYLRECVTRTFIDQERFERTLELAEHTRAKALNFTRYHRKKSAARVGRFVRRT
ncbi:MAG: four helix bundle protein [Acidobacteriota bacterium]|nr:four helix bundle protein [Acidobacteriota bacterium]